MPVQLRQRRSRPSYKTVIELPDDDEHIEEEPSGDSEYESPGDAKDELDEEEFANPSEEEGDEKDLLDNDEPLIAAIRTTKKGKGKSNGNPKPSRAVSWSSTNPRASIVQLAPGLSRPVQRQQYALPAPSVNHRHRGIPLYFPYLRTLRLASKPSPFLPAETVWTRSIGDSEIQTRLTKAAGYNFGRGPVWDLLEDRSWYKESTGEGQRRPIVYDALQMEEPKVLSESEAAKHLPGYSPETSEVHTLPCYFGPFEQQTKLDIKPLQAISMSEFFPQSQAHAFYAGAPVWAMDWCPVSDDELPRRNFKQYLAVAPFPSHNHHPEIGRRASRPSPACIQIWSLSPSSKGGNKADDPGEMKCELIICIDGGPAHDLKWCPLPSHDKHLANDSQSQSRKLGILAGAFEDGSLSFYVVPDPGALGSSAEESISPPSAFLSPRLRIELDDAAFLCLDWGNSDIIAAGLTNGSLAVFHVKETLEKDFSKLRPSSYISVHQSAVRCICWAKAPPASATGVPQIDTDPTVLLSGGYDGAQMVTDIREQRSNVMNRTRDVSNSIAFSHHVGGSLVSDNENMVKNFSLIPSMLGRGHIVVEPCGPIWSIGTSDFHPQVAVGSADGTCQTTNILKSTRRGGAVPFLVHRIFQMDYNRNSREFRMIEQFMPYEHQDRPAASRTNDGASATSLPASTGAWSPEISVTRVVWQSSSDMARAPLLASATASGLCRVDWLLGRFAQNRFPYTNIEVLRGEVEGDIDAEGEYEDE